MVASFDLCNDAFSTMWATIIHYEQDLVFHFWVDMWKEYFIEPSGEGSCVRPCLLLIKIRELCFSCFSPKQHEFFELPIIERGTFHNPVAFVGQHKV